MRMHTRLRRSDMNRFILCALICVVGDLCLISGSASAGAEKSGGWGTTVEQPASPPAGPKTEPAAKPASPSPQSKAPAPSTPDPPPAASTAGESDSVQSIAFGDWLLACAPARGKQVCALSQTVRDAQNRRLIQMTARRAAQASYIELLVPVGVSIPYGVSIVVSDTLKVPAPLVDCGIDGCRAVVALDAKTLQHFKAAKSLAVTFQDSKSGKVISISGSPKGFDQGIAMVLAGS